MRLRIPGIRVDATIEALGVTPSGDMDVPPNSEDVGWYKYGPRPGEQGSAVIAGHFGTLRGKPSVFNNLKKVKKGDPLSVLNADGLTSSYIVRNIRIYRANDLTTGVFESGSGAHLNLITCTGTWDKIDKSFKDRLVVFTDRVQ